MYIKRPLSKNRAGSLAFFSRLHNELLDNYALNSITSLHLNANGEQEEEKLSERRV
jgi:hypothetical protein